MTYQVKFADSATEKKFQKALLKICHKSLHNKIIEAMQALSSNPRPYGKMPFKKLKPPIQFYQFTAQYRLRIGDYRVLYDVDDAKKIVWILALRLRSEKTYK